MISFLVSSQVLRIMQTIGAVQSMDINTLGCGAMPHLLDTSKDSYENVTARLVLVVADDITGKY